MKPDEHPKCYVEANDGHWICYVMEYKGYDMIDVEENTSTSDMLLRFSK